MESRRLRILAIYIFLALFLIMAVTAALSSGFNDVYGNGSII